MKRHLPNFITCLNLLCGCLAIVYAFQGNLIMSSYLVFLAALFDFLDGLMARLLKAYSAIGKQLDSLADMVSFGVVPGVIMYNLLQQTNFGAITLNYKIFVLMKFSPFLITIFSALRLAKFNIDPRQTSSFIGVPTPAVSIFFASFPLILQNDILGLGDFILNPFILIGLIFLMSYMLVAEIPLFALKFKNLKWLDNKIQYVLLLISIPLILLLFYSSIPIIIFLYVVLSMINNTRVHRLEHRR